MEKDGLASEHFKDIDLCITTLTNPYMAMHQQLNPYSLNGNS